jgi:leucyl aminopeptidase (aminopeptidase T)
MFVEFTARNGQKHYINVNHVVRVTYTPPVPNAWPENVYLSLKDGTVVDIDTSYEDACKQVINY